MKTQQASTVTVYQTFPISVRQLKVELETYEKRMKALAEQPSHDRGEMQMLFMEFVTRKDRLRALASIHYEPVFDLNGLHKKALKDIFNRLDGFSWSHRFGWIGQSKTPTRIEIDPFVVAAPLYDGLHVEKY
jgi:hypothetical protein